MHKSVDERHLQNASLKATSTKEVLKSTMLSESLGSVVKGRTKLFIAPLSRTGGTYKEPASLDLSNQLKGEASRSQVKAFMQPSRIDMPLYSDSSPVQHKNSLYANSCQTDLEEKGPQLFKNLIIQK
mmetsp:Transcript_29858/g.34217  ORF Transcript_29858/g.34217 Transcript_29858/m.34217 type:complete len:127 (+) Transcript_29858:344-724(+)